MLVGSADRTRSRNDPQNAHSSGKLSGSDSASTNSGRPADPV